MKILFLSGGQREKALRYILENKENVVGVITPFLTEKNRRFEKVILTAVEYGVPVYPVTRDTMKAQIEKINFDILVSCGFPYIINKEVLAIPKYAINVHPTLLPKYRGYRSGPYIVINGEKQTGVTVHLLTEGMDQGDIIVQQAYELTPFDTIKSIYRKNGEIEPRLLYKAIQMIKSGDLKLIPQDEKKATVYNYIRTPKDSEIDWNKSLKDLYNEIRASDPNDYPAFFFVDGQKVCIKIWRPYKPTGQEDMI